MSSEKTSFVLYHDYKDTVDKLDNEQAGKLFKMILDYVNGEEVIAEDLILELVFLPIKKSLKRDLQKYENKIKKRSYAGILGNLKKYTPDIYDKYEAGKIDIDEAQELAKVRKARTCEKPIANIADSVSGNGSGTVNKTVNKTVDVDGDAEKVTIAAARDLFLKNEEVVSAIKELFLIKSDSELKEWLRLYHLHLTTEKKSEKTPQDYISHFKSCMKKNTLEQYKNDGFSSTAPKRFDQDLGKLPRVGENTSDGISTFTIEEFKNSLETSSAGEYVKSLYEAYQLKPMKLGFIVDKFILHIKCQGPGNQPKNIKEASKYFNNWCKQEIEKGNLNSYLKHPKKQIGAL